MKNSLFALAIVCSLLSCKNTPTVSADIVLINGKIYTVDDNQPWVEAVAIKDGKFMVVGSNEEVNGFNGESTELVDLAGKFMMPGLVEDHIHPDMIAENKMNIEITSPDMTYEEFGKEVERFLAEFPDTKWIFGGPMNWLKDKAGNIDVWDQPSHFSILDRLVNDRPAFFWDLGGHAALINSYAMEEFGINDNNQPPAGGSWDRDNDGNLTGVLRETAANAVWEAFLLERASPEEQAERGFIPVFGELNSCGFTSITDVWARPWNLDVYKYLEQNNQLTARVTIYATDPADWTSDWIKEMSSEFIAQGPTRFSDKINLIGVKFVMDGSAGGQTAVMSEPFEGTDNKGYWRTDPEVLMTKILEYDQNGLTVRSHGVGDQTISTILDAIEQTRKNGSTLRHSVSHTVFVNPKDYNRFKQLDVSAEISPYFWMPDPSIETIRADVGDERLKWIFPIRSLQELGVHISTGSDAPVSPFNPWKPMEGMITRQLPGGEGDPVNAEDHSIKIEDAIYIYTMGGAYNQYKENEIGSITVGKFADFIVLDQNLLEIETTTIHQTKVLATYLEGDLVFERK